MLQPLRKVLRISVLILTCTLLLLGTLGCNEEFLRNMSEEQRETYLSYLERYNPDKAREYRELFGSPTAISAAVDTQLPDRSPAVRASSEPTIASWSDSIVSDDQCQSLLETAPRGLACLQCTHPKAQAQARILVSLLYRSCLKNVAINYLVDGTFSYDPEVLLEHIRVLTSGGRTLFLHLYITNGASQRRWKSTGIEALGVQISPEEFRRRIVSDANLQGEYQNLVRRLIPIIAFAQQRGAVISLVPALEDNLTDESFKVIQQLTLDALPVGALVSMGRNPCPSCYKGNTSSSAEGGFMEVHTTSAHGLRTRSGVVTNDGRGYTHYQSTPDAVQGDDISLEGLSGVRDAASRNNNVFILWSAQRQGLSRGFAGRGPYPHPDLRNYHVPPMGERRAILDFLREGVN